MKQSQLFTKTKKESPKDEMAKNAILLSRAGFIHKEMAGVYSYLPLGLRVIKNIENIIREEMNAIGGIEMKTSIFQNKEIWEKSNRWDDNVVDNWFKTKLKNGGEVGLSFTNEEAYSNILKQYVSSYKDLPVYPYDFKEIFRNEARSKSGIMRGREFYWKALYSFSKNKEEHDDFYKEATQAYERIFKRVGIGNLTYITFASGGTFSKYSHEFQAISDAGEDIIYVDEDKKLAINKELINEESLLKEMGLNREKLAEKKAIEVGNIFTLGTKFSEPFDLKYKNEKGEDNLVFMGSYGIGLGRLMGTIVELLSDENGIMWPKEVSPFKAHLLLVSTDEKIKKLADDVYEKLIKKGVEVLYDDREMRAGEKFADSDLIGIPMRIIVGDKTMDSTFEVKDRATGKVEQKSLEDIIHELK